MRSPRPAARLPVLDHLRTLTDDTGIVQHATHDIPNRSTGYCTDDVARAFMVSVRACAHPSLEPEARRLGAIYLAFLLDAQLADGGFHNFLGYDRRWQDLRAGGDGFGRAVWALGFGMRHARRDSWRQLCDRMLVRALAQVPRADSVHALAYAGLGLAYALGAPGAHAPMQAGAALVRRELEHVAVQLLARYDASAAPDWPWPERCMTYDNARLCEAFIRIGVALDDERLRGVGLTMLAFYEGIAIEDGIFVPIGNVGWYPRGGVRSRLGQQPLEAAAAVDAGLLAFSVTGEPYFRTFAEAGHAWFGGRNTANALLVTDGGCRDGIDAHGPSTNMGAESTLAYLASALALAPVAEAKRSISTLR